MHNRWTVAGLSVLASGAVIGVTSAAPAQAANAPVGQCPPPYTLAEATTPVAMDVDSRGNGDGWICRLPATHGALVGTANLIDNYVPLRVTF